MGNSAEADSAESLHKPALDVDLSTLLPQVVQQLMFGKGRGYIFVNDQVSKIKRAQTGEDAKSIIRRVVQENFFPECAACTAEIDCTSTGKHLFKVVEWLYALMMKRRPWTNWTHDIYDAMRCIDHLPIS